MPIYEFEGKQPHVDQRAFVHPTATLIGEVEVGAGCYIGAGAVLRGDIGSVSVGPGSNVQENCVLHAYPGQGVTLHPDTHIGHGSILHGCEIGPNVLVGMGSMVADGARIHADCLVGARAFVRFEHQIPAGSVVLGNPAKVVRRITEEELEARVRAPRRVYVELAQRYLDSFRCSAWPEEAGGQEGAQGKVEGRPV